MKTMKPYRIVCVALAAIMGATGSSPLRGAPPKDSFVNAVREEDTDAMRRWLKADMSQINAYTADGLTPLQLAVCRYRPRAFDLLLASGADVNLPTKPGRLRIVSNERIYLIGLSRKDWTPLHIAVQGNRTDMVKALIARGAKINVRNDFGETPLFLACSEGYTTMARLLIANGADMNMPAQQRGLTPLQTAVFSGYEDLAQILFANGAKADLLSAAGLGLKYEVDRILTEKPNLMESPEGAEASPLYWAARGGHSNLVRYLAEKGAKVDVRDERGATALIEAASLGYSNVVRALLVADADVTARDKSGQTALHHAAAGGHATVVRTLLEYQADPATVDIKGQHPVDLAIANGHAIIADLLENRPPQATVQRAKVRPR